MIKEKPAPDSASINYGACTNHFVAAARDLYPLLQSEAAQGERLRSPSPAVDQALRSSGLLGLMLPHRWGGAGLSVTNFARVQMELARGDPSVAWVSQIINSSTFVSSLSPDETQAALFGDGPKSICGVFAPPGTARRTEGGWIVNGTWPYTSGSRQADLGQFGVIVQEPGAAPGLSIVFIPMRDITIRDTWFMAGLQGTGSDTSVAADVFVPDVLLIPPERSFGTPDPGKVHTGAPSDNLPMAATLRSIGLAHIVGTAAAMLEIVERESKTKPIVSTSYRTRIESGAVVHDLGRVAAQLDTARLLLFSATGLMDEIGATGRAYRDDERARHKAQSAQVVELVHSAIERLMFIAGSSAFALSNPISRYWRDAHVALRHVTNLPFLGYEIYGRDRLDIAPNISPLNGY